MSSEKKENEYMYIYIYAKINNLNRQFYMEFDDT